MVPSLGTTFELRNPKTSLKTQDCVSGINKDSEDRYAYGASSPFPIIAFTFTASVCPSIANDGCKEPVGPETYLQHRMSAAALRDNRNPRKYARSRPYSRYQDGLRGRFRSASLRNSVQLTLYNSPQRHRDFQSEDHSLCPSRTRSPFGPNRGPR